MLHSALFRRSLTGRLGVRAFTPAQAKAQKAKTDPPAVGTAASPPKVKKRARVDEFAHHDLAYFLRSGQLDGVQAHDPGRPVPVWDKVEFKGFSIPHRPYELYSKSRIKQILDSKLVGDHVNRRELLAAASVLPMRTNNYVVDDLIDWSNVPQDPIFQLTFPQPGMLEPEHLQRMCDLLGQDGVTPLELREEAETIRNTLNPHPAGQKQLNVPKVNFNGEIVDIPGLQHKYRETCLFFPMESQYCHAFCTYCFRWAQFTAVGSEQTFSAKDPEIIAEYLRQNKDITDLLFTGGDPMVMTARQFSRYIDPILCGTDHEHINTIRIGTKSLAYWPYRFVTEDDADDILRMFERIQATGRQVSIMAHFSHWRELTTPVVQEAMRRIRLSGANIRTQAPLIRRVNDDPQVWAEKWRLETRLGLIPYYMFVERDTGARHYFEVPLVKGWEIYREAVAMQSGLGRTVRGPSMSCTPGKVHMLGVVDVPKRGDPKKTEKAILLQFLQGRNPEWVGKPFLAKYDENVCWMDKLQPFEGKEFFFEEELRRISDTTAQSSGQLYYHDEAMNNWMLPTGLTDSMYDDMARLQQERRVFTPRR